MSRGNIAAAHEARRIALAGYPTWVQITPDLHPVEAAIRYLVPSRSRADIVALFDQRAAYQSIMNWRQGRRHLPEWARELLTKKLRAEIERRAKIIETL